MTDGLRIALTLAAVLLARPLLELDWAKVRAVFRLRASQRRRFLDAPAQRAAWFELARHLGWTLDRGNATLEGDYAGYGVSVDLPHTYLGGAMVVRLDTTRRPPELRLAPASNWALDDAPTRTSETVPASTQALVRDHEVTIETTARGIQATVPRTDAELVEPILLALRGLVEAGGSYRGAAPK
ncbi:MAG: hypothetical protein KC731_24490 [Myxococcales bacterium]|nr:hypothetical protein [Myxococcales bacterium]